MARSNRQFRLRQTPDMHEIKVGNVSKSIIEAILFISLLHITGIVRCDIV